MEKKIPPSSPRGRIMGNYLENFGNISQPWQFRRDKKGKHTMQMTPPQMEPKKKPRLTSDERKRIEKMLDDGWTPYKIAKALGRPLKTVMREIVNRAIKSLKGSVGRINNRCQDYIEQKCERLESSPFVCNGCGERHKCPLAKKLYVADDAQENSANVTAAFGAIRDRLVGKFGKDAGLAIMGELFAVVLTDNGTEFSNPLAIEFDCEGNRIANLFYCNPGERHRPQAEAPRNRAEGQAVGGRRCQTISQSLQHTNLCHPQHTYCQNQAILDRPLLLRSHSRNKSSAVNDFCTQSE